MKQWSLPQVQELLDLVRSRSEGNPLADGPQKMVIQLCTSLSVVMIKQELMFDAVALLQIANQADGRLGRLEGDGNKLWEGRLFLLNATAYLYQLMRDFPTSIKSLQSAQALLSSSSPSPELLIQTHFLTSFVLWKTQKYRSAAKFASICMDYMDELRHTNRVNSTISALIVVLNVAISVKLGANLEAAKNTLFALFHRFQPSDLAIKRTIQRVYALLNRLNPVENSENDLEIPLEIPPNSPLPGLPDSYLDGIPGNSADLLVDSAFENLVFVAFVMSGIRRK